MLVAKDISKYYKELMALKEFNMKLEKGKAIGIIGVNGSGKTTFFKVLLNLLEKDSGSIEFKNQDIRTYKNSLLGYLPEERSLYKDLTVFDQVMFLGRLKEMEDNNIEERLDYYLKYLNVKQYKFTHINKLSKGNQQKIQIICALIHDPKIVILDEPLSGLDIVNVNLLKKLIHKLKSEGKYILLSSHQFEHIEEFCEDLIILKKGYTTFSGSVDDLINMSSAYYINLSKEIGHKYLDKLEYTSLKVSERYYQFEIDNEESAKAYFKEIVLKEDNDSISLLKPSIAMVVREMDYI